MGGILQSLDNQDIVVDLSDNGIKYLTEDQFKPFVEKKRNGYIKLDNNPLDCRCDVQVREEIYLNVGLKRYLLSFSGS